MFDDDASLSSTLVVHGDIDDVCFEGGNCVGGRSSGGGGGRYVGD